MADEIVVVVKVQAAEGKGDEVLAAFSKAAEATHAEEGCLAYALHRDLADQSTFVLVERWRSQADLDAHNGSPHVAELFTVAGTPGMLAGAPDLTFTTPLGVGDATKGRL